METLSKSKSKSKMETKQFKSVSYLWDEKKAAELAGDEVALLVYRSNFLGADLRLTNYGGGNTSCKVLSKDPLTGKETEVMWIKGSGGDLGSMKRSGLAALYVDRLRSLTNVYRGIKYEDEMVELFNHCIYDLSSKAPSIDTPLHGFLPFKHIDHLHPDAAIAIAAAKDGKKITQELFDGTIGVQTLIKSPHVIQSGGVDSQITGDSPGVTPSQAVIGSSMAGLRYVSRKRLNPMAAH
jgi:hypothetical protein